MKKISKMAEFQGTASGCITTHVRIDPFPIIGFYLYHVISADQSNNWTTSGI